MDVQTQKEGDVAAQNYAVAAFQHKVLKRSIIKGIFINKQATTTTSAANEYARNAGLEFTYISEKGTFNNNVRFHTSLNPEKFKDNNYFGVSGNYTSKKIRTGWDIDFVGENFITEVGINPRLNNYDAAIGEVVRLGYSKINAWMRYLIFTKNEKSKLNYHGPRTWHYLYLNKDGSFNEAINNLAYDFNYKNTSRLDFHLQYRKVNLMFPTSLLGDDFVSINCWKLFLYQY